MSSLKSLLLSLLLMLVVFKLKCSPTGFGSCNLFFQSHLFLCIEMDLSLTLFLSFIYLSLAWKCHTPFISCPGLTSYCSRKAGFFPVFILFFFKKRKHLFPTSAFFFLTMPWTMYSVMKMERIHPKLIGFQQASNLINEVLMHENKWNSKRQKVLYTSQW